MHLFKMPPDGIFSGQLGAANAMPNGMSRAAGILISVYATCC